MASPVVEIRFNDAEFGPLMLRTTELNAQRGIRKVTSMIEAAAVKKAPERTSNLVDSITSSVSGRGFDTEGTVKATAKYALYVETGTGIFGPKGQPIFPKKGKALKFTVGGKTVFARSVKGMRAKPFLKPAFEEEGPKLRNLIFR